MKMKRTKRLRRNRFIFLIVLVFTVLTVSKIIPRKWYTNADFNIKTYVSDHDQDHDGVDDQSDIYSQ